MHRIVLREQKAGVILTTWRGDSPCQAMSGLEGPSLLSMPSRAVEALKALRAPEGLYGLRGQRR